MTLTAGTKLGRYKIRSVIGIGGMGEVYLANDPKIGRDVAIKVLPADFAADKDRVARFELEAQAAGALNHPNILAIYDVDTQDDLLFVVSELLEGDELRDRLDEGPIPLRKVIDYAQQIVSGLTAAHEKGIVHRDLKPENLFITKDDRVKILDFGLAKLRETDSSIHGSEDATRKALTDPGMVMGTVGYMSPEQVRGQMIDHRSDIFSFGAILYEMITGKRAFQEESLAETMSAIVKEEPPEMTESNPSISPALERIVHRCLEKKPERRFHSAHDLGFALESLTTITSSSGGTLTASVSGIAPETESSGWKARFPWIAAGALALVLVALTAWILLIQSPAPRKTITLDVAAPPGWSTTPTSAISPDGSRLAFTAEQEPDKPFLWVRDIATGESRMIEDTEGAVEPFWSPDGAEIAYFTANRLRAVTLDTGKSRDICDVSGARRGGAWSPGDVIVFSTEAGLPLRRVNADGKSAPSELPYRGYRPFFLPDGRHFLFGHGRRGGISVGDLETGETKEISPDGKEPKYVDGYLLFVLDGSLMAREFDPASYEISEGEPITLADIGRHNGEQNTNFSVAENGLIAFRRQAENIREIALYSRDGTRTAAGEAGTWSNPVFSPDDSMVALERDGDIWLIEPVRGSGRMFASGRPTFAYSPLWAVDGNAVIYFKIGVGIVENPLDGGSPRTVIEAKERFPYFTQMTNDGRAIGFTLRDGNRDISIVSSAGEVEYFAQSTANETQPALSPDGRWLAYVFRDAARSGGTIIFVESFPNGGRKIRISDEIGGAQPRWRRDGSELYFVAADGTLMAVPVEEVDGALKTGTPTALFKTRVPPQSGLGTRAFYDATRDGSRFFVTEEKETPGVDTQPVTVLVNWKSLLTKQ